MAWRRTALVSFVLLFLISVSFTSPAVAETHSEEGEVSTSGGIMPDSPFYVFDVVMDNVMVSIGFRDVDSVARERANETREMAMEQKEEAMQEAMGHLENALDRLEMRVSGIDRALKEVENHASDTAREKVREIRDRHKEKPVCRETDGGLDVFTSGVAETSDERVEDQCIEGDSENGLREAYCTQHGNIETVTKDCPGECIDGACVEQEGHNKPSCEDTDGGIVPDERGVAESEEKRLEDHCVENDTENRLREAFCADDGQPQFETKDCAGECTDGRCVSDDETTAGCPDRDEDGVCDHQDDCVDIDGDGFGSGPACEGKDPYPYDPERPETESTSNESTDDGENVTGNTSSGAEPAIVFDPDRYSSTQELKEDPYGVFSDTEIGGNYSLDTDVGYPGGSKSMRYDWVDQGVNNAVSIGRNIPLSSGQKEAWVEFQARWSENFMNITDFPKDGSTFAHKFFFFQAQARETAPNWETSDGEKVGRWSLIWPAGGSNTPPNAPIGVGTPRRTDGEGGFANPAGHIDGLDAAQYFDGEWHTVRWHVSHDPGFYELWIDGELVSQVDFASINPEIDITAALPGRNKDDGIREGVETLWWGPIKVWTEDPGWGLQNETEQEPTSNESTEDEENSTGTDNDGDGYNSSVDCNDNDATINPGATETCDGVDNNCDGTVDEGCSTSADLIFQSGFEPDSQPVDSVITDITGTDNSVAPPNNWDNFKGSQINYVCGSNDERWAKIVDDPTADSDNRVMHYWLEETQECNADTRVQNIIWETATERYQKVRMYLTPDMKELIGSDVRGDWFMLHEIWIRPNWIVDENPFRIDINAKRGDVGGTEKFYWSVDANSCCNSGWETFWEVNNKDVEVPIGEWFTAEVYYKMGDNNHGRVVFTIQKDGGPKQVVANVTDWTYHPDEGPEGISVWQPLKLYVAPSNVDHVRNDGGALQVYWDDYEVWSSRPY